MKPIKLALVCNPEDKPFTHTFKSLVASAECFFITQPMGTLTEVIDACKRKGITGVITNQEHLVKKLLNKYDDEKLSLDVHAGSLIHKDGIDFLLINPLAHLVTVTYGKFIFARYLSKLLKPEAWPTYPEFSYTKDVEEFYSFATTSFIMACDIETFKVKLAIRCIGYTAARIHNGVLEFKTLVLPIDSEYNLAWMRKINDLPADKIFQNGKYDNSYLLRYNAPCKNYLWDTATMFHAWYSELPKDLATLSAFFVRYSRNWKELSDTYNLEEYYEYNGRDTYNTLIVALEWIKQAPEWAKSNYRQEFPLLYPCLLAEMTGIKRDIPKLHEARAKLEKEIEEENQSLSRCLGVTAFNVSSPVQVKNLLAVLGCKDLESSDEKSLQKAAFRHPLNELLINKILSIRKKRKLISTYLKTGEEASEFNGRILSAINPHGTDTGRLASKEHHFWCGVNLQNQPRGVTVKQTLVADEGFSLFESDLEQAESRDTANISGDEALIAAVSGDRDFHSVNCSAFFGVPYDQIYNQEKQKTINKALRDLAKRVNHGANYNMGANTLVDTMGLRAVHGARKLLNLPFNWAPKQVAEHLLAQFHKTYPKIAKVYYEGVIHEVKVTSKISSKARFLPHDNSIGYDVRSWYNSFSGWTRYCFGDPTKNKLILNSYVAHAPQSLNAMTLNKAFMRVFYEIALPNKGNFKLLCQIHDSILFQCRKGYEHLALEVKKCMEIPVEVKGYDGVTRTFIVPAALKAGPDGMGAPRWSETE